MSSAPTSGAPPSPEEDERGQAEEDRERKIDEAVEESFPASDPPAWAPTVVDGGQ